MAKEKTEAMISGISDTHYTYMDIIRILATYLVIFTHTGDIGSKLYIYGNYDGIRKLIYIVADVVRCINVPLFFMISGALLLPKEESYKRLFSKRVVKYVVVLISMSYFYFVVYYKNSWYDLGLFFKQLCTEYVTGLYWFLYAYLGYLLILPFLRKLVKVMEKKDFRYFMILGILFKGILNVGIGLCGWSGRFLVPFYLGEDAVFYPVMGFYFANLISTPEEIDRKVKRELGIGGVLSLICILGTVYMMHWEACRTGEYSETYLMNFTVIPTLFAFGVIKSGCLKFNISEKGKKLIRFIADNSFGVYLFSVFAQINLVEIYFFINDKTGGEIPLISSYLYVLAVMMIEVVVIALLRKIPLIRRFI